MRHPRKSVDKIPDMKHKAAVISKILDDGLNEFSALEKRKSSMPLTTRSKWKTPRPSQPF